MVDAGGTGGIGRGPQRLTAPQDALSALLDPLPAPVAPRRLPVEEAVGLALAEPLLAAVAVPDRPAAIHDGWAVAAADTLGAGPYSPAVLPGAPARVAPGDALPPGTDAVLPPFDLEADGPLPQALAPLAPGEGVRRMGEEIGAGTVLRAAGGRLAARDLPALAALGIAEVAVRVPRLAWIAAGPGIAADPARDTLRPLFAALAREAGATLHPAPPQPPDPAAIAAALRAAAAGHDLLILAGGSGDGPEDRSAEGLSGAGRLLFHGLGARPGSSAGAGLAEGRPVVLLPGRVEDALAAWLLLVRPLLEALSGAAPAPALRLRLTRKVASTVGLADLVPLRVDGGGGAEPLAVGSLPLAALSAAGAVLVVPPGSEGYEAGTEITALPL
jgi:molybdopterin molybdotransferase